MKRTELKGYQKSNEETSDINILSRTSEVGCAGSNGYGGSDFELIDEDGNLITGQDFNSDFIFTGMQDPNLDQLTGEVYESDIPFILRVPKFEGAINLDITAKGLTKSVQLNYGEDNLLCLVK